MIEAAHRGEKIKSEKQAWRALPAMLNMIGKTIRFQYILPHEFFAPSIFRENYAVNSDMPDFCLSLLL
jgi:hypothetical protein